MSGQTRTVTLKVVGEAASYEAAMEASGKSTQTLSAEMKRAAKQSEAFARASLAARSANLEAAASAKVAATAQDRATAATERATKAQEEAAVANRLAAEAADKLENGQIDAAEAAKLSEAAAKRDERAQAANARAMRAAADAATQLERASIKAGVAQLAQSKIPQAGGGSSSSTSDSGGIVAGLLNKGVKALASQFLAEGQEAGELFGNGLSGGLKALMSTPPEVSIPIIIGTALIATAALSYIGAAVGGALIAGVGVAGFAGAIAGQIHNPAVVAALSDLKKRAEDTLTDASSGFTTPLLNGIQIVDNGLDKVGPDLKGIFDALAPDFDVFVAGVTGLVENLMPGLTTAAESAGPIFDELGQDLPGLGESISGFLDDISADSEASAAAMSAAFDLIEFAVADLGLTIEGLELTFGFLLADTKLAVDVLAKIPGMEAVWGPVAHQVDQLAASTDKAAKSGTTFQGSAAGAANAAKSLDDDVTALSDDFDNLVQGNLSADRAALQYKDDLAALAATIKDNGTSLDENTAKGRSNRESLDGLVEGAERARQAYIEQHSATDGVAQATADADLQFQGNIRTLVNQADKLGLSKNAVAALIGRILGIPASKVTNFKTPGLADAQRQIQILQAQINRIKDKRITITTHFVETGNRSGTHVEGYDSGGRMLAPDRWGGIKSFEAGGIYQPAAKDGYYRFAEPATGGEALIPRLGDASRSMAITDVAAGWYGGTVAWPGQQGGGAAAQPTVLSPSFDVRVFVGDQEVRDITRVEIREHDRQLKAEVRAKGGRS